MIISESIRAWVRNHDLQDTLRLMGSGEVIVFILVLLRGQFLPEKVLGGFGTDEGVQDARGRQADQEA